MFKKVCKECNNDFVCKYKAQKYCKNPCRKEKTQAEIWLDKKPITNQKRKNEQAIAYSFFRKKYGPNKSYRACRG